VSKQAFVYVLDRATGEPSGRSKNGRGTGNEPGEWYAPTQPFPTKPPAYDQQGVAIDDLIDFTPELRQEAVAILKPVYSNGACSRHRRSQADRRKTKRNRQMPGAARRIELDRRRGDP
jgi:hypothetical protein